MAFKFRADTFKGSLLRQLIANTIKRSNYEKDQEIGLELELEGFGATQMPEVMFQIPGCVWTPHADPSLRGDSCELVLAQPLSYKSIVDTAIPQYKKICKDSRFKPALSHRCSFHVHLDFSHKTIYDLIRFITVYAVYEPYFFSAVGSQRKGNHFCISLREAENFVDNVISSFVKGDFGFCVPEDNRYMALNLAALAKFGSVEIRLHEGVTDPDLIIRWIDVLMELLEYSKTQYKENPQQLIEAISMNGLEQVTQERFPNVWKLIEPHFGEVHIRDGLDVAQDIAYAGTWDEAPTEVEQVAPQKKPQGPGQSQPGDRAPRDPRQLGNAIHDGTRYVARTTTTEGRAATERDVADVYQRYARMYTAGTTGSIMRLDPIPQIREYDNPVFDTLEDGNEGNI